MSHDLSFLKCVWEVFTPDTKKFHFLFIKDWVDEEMLLELKNETSIDELESVCANEYLVRKSFEKTINGKR